ncbi:hypothetical protein N7478_002165 [Penicillium angulare]|uniref:uncharacterized protein n=1 Tax=Penicillium angulare TaxID=116970 RepID=UPI0025400D1F|nr:uncharacterized protein N7478_002165 [Penicillium angulare]KAJ5289135.1 hypothetical protein N7478_002165 [Penicillium angulare]
MNLLLGCIYFALKGASEEVKIFEKMAEITRLMKEKLQAFSSSIPPGISCQSELEEVIGEALLDMFIALIEFWADAMEFLREEESQTSFPCYILDACNQLFGGREQELGGIMKHLTAEDAAQNLNIYVIHGLGGTGKSSLALAYAHESQKARTYDAIFWVHAYSAPAFRESFDEIAVRLDFPRASKKGENINNNVNLVKNWLAKTNIQLSHPGLAAEQRDVCWEDWANKKHRPFLIEVEEAIDRLMERSLVQREGENISLHRLVQQAFRRSNFKYRPEARQEAYNAAVTLLNYYFPKMGGASSLYDQWATCEELLNHSLALADLVLNDRTHKKSFESSPELEELLKNSAWYQYEIGALRESQQLLKIAMNICRDKSSLLYAQLCNNLGVIYFDWNDLFECKKHLQECLSIRVSLLEPNHIELANIYSNLAGMHAADGNLDEALRLYTMCDDIRSQTPTEGYYYRNLELARDNTTRATQKFEDADTQKLDSAPKAQLLKCAIQYKIGFCKAKLGQFHEAIGGRKRFQLR